MEQSLSKSYFRVKLTTIIVAAVLILIVFLLNTEHGAAIKAAKTEHVLKNSYIIYGIEEVPPYRIFRLVTRGPNPRDTTLIAHWDSVHVYCRGNLYTPQDEFPATLSGTPDGTFNLFYYDEAQLKRLHEK